MSQSGRNQPPSNPGQNPADPAVAGVNWRETFNISRWAITYPKITIGFWLAVVVAGCLAFSTLKFALFPDITFPVVIVQASAPLNSVLDTEAQLTGPIETQVKGIQGLEGVRSTIYAGQTTVSMAFSVGTNLDTAQRQVEAKVQPLSPKGGSIQVIPLNLNESAVVSYVLQGQSQSLEALTRIAKEKVVGPIGNIPGVLKVNLLGAPATESPKPGEPPSLSAVRLNGQEGLALQVIKRGNANTLEVVKQVEAQVETLKTQLGGATLTLAATQATYIHEATQATIESLGIAIVLAGLVIFPFLNNWRATVISALAIPTALCGTFIVMAAFGFNLETITLLALALVVGIIVDDAIVDVENIARHLEDGTPPRQAALVATTEIGLTVTAATLTIVAVFLPVGLMGGTVGQFFKPFGVTVSAAVLVSLLVARTLSPLLAVHWLRPQSETATPPIMAAMTAQYTRLLAWSLSHRAAVAGLALLSLVTSIGLVPLVPKGFIPKLDRGEFNLIYQVPFAGVDQAAAETLAQAAAQTLAQSAAQADPDLTPEQIQQKIQPQVQQQVQQQLQQQVQRQTLQNSRTVAGQLEAAARQVPAVETLFTTIGSRPGQPNMGKLYVRLKADRQGQTTAQVQAQLRQQLPQGVTAQVEDIPFVETGGESTLQIALQGDDLAALGKAAQSIQTDAAKVAGMIDVTASNPARALASSDSERSPITEPITLERFNGKRVAYVRANLAPTANLGQATDQLVAIAQRHLSPGLTLALGGDSAQASEVFGSFGVTLGLSVLCIVAVLLLLFRSWLDPLVIVAALPLSLLGAILMILITGSDFGMISVIGIIFLLGLTNKNAILIVDYINQLRQAGKTRNEAILIAAPIRLRPILMTTAATLLGMLPLALKLGEGSELRAPMAITIMGGLITSTLLSLVVIPVVYSGLDDLRSGLQRRRPDKTSR
jgi:multidrug efflux pump subunit AcrB